MTHFSGAPASHHGKRDDAHEGRLADEDLGDHQLAHRVLDGVLYLPGDLLGPSQLTAVVDPEVHLQDLIEGAVGSGKANT